MPEIFDKLVIGISSTALFDLTIANKIYKNDGLEAYINYQLMHENEPLMPGSAFLLVQKLLALNQYGPYVEIIILSRNSADSGLRVFNSIAHYNLDITRAAFTSGKSPHLYAEAFAADLLLLTNPEDVKISLSEGFAAAQIMEGTHNKMPTDQKIRIAFDADAVIFSDESEKIFKEKGLDAFVSNEQTFSQKPLPAGPFAKFLKALNKIQKEFPELECPIRTALITARAAPAHERVIRTLRTLNIRLDETVFLGGLKKGDFLKAFNADLYFDDYKDNCIDTNKYVPTGHVLSGVNNRKI